MDTNNTIKATYTFQHGVNITALLAKVEKYNKDAIKFGDFPLWSFNNDSLTLIGEFRPKPETGVGFMKTVKNTYQNGYLKEDFDKICNLSASLGGIRN